MQNALGGGVKGETNLPWGRGKVRIQGQVQAWSVIWLGLHDWGDNRVWSVTCCG